MVSFGGVRLVWNGVECFVTPGQDCCLGEEGTQTGQEEHGCESELQILVVACRKIHKASVLALEEKSDGAGRSVAVLDNDRLGNVSIW